jgi:cell division protein FtsL
MTARKLYDDYYEVGTAAKKIHVEKQVKKAGPAINKKTNVKKMAKAHAKATNNVSMFFFIICAFSMAMFITYRFNLINEKNLSVQSLKKELSTAEATLASSQIEVEQNTDVNKIEAYAKQQLGMQKPDKNQTIYVDTSKTNKSLEVEQDMTSLEKVLNSMKNIINSIF